MRLLCLNGSDVRQALPMSACIEAMAEAFAALARGEARLPLRQMLRLPDGQNTFAAMPASLGRDGPDLAAARNGCTRVQAGGLGTWLDLSGPRDPRA